MRLKSLQERGTTFSSPFSFFHPLLLASVLMLLALLVQASVMEDGYITFRVVDNVVNGEGLRWNLHERVQPYTNPLWMLLHIPFYAVYRHMYFDTMLISALCTVTTLWLVAVTFKKSALATACLLLVPLALSRAFTVYATSGFENSLTHLLFACAGWVLVCARPRYFWLLLGLCTSLSMANRLDTVVFYVPIWCYQLYTKRGQVQWLQLLAGFAPIISWELFSLFYYGFLFPNTKYAKLNTGIGEGEYLQLGISYLLNLIAVDGISACALFAAIGMLPALWRRYRRTNGDGVYLSVAASIFLYVVYVVFVGGTYLSGRLFSLPVLASVWLLFGVKGCSVSVRWMAMLVVALCMVKLAYPATPWLNTHCPVCFRGVDPVEGEAKDKLLDVFAGKIIISEPNMLHTPHPVYVEWSMGRWGYAMDRQVKIIDGFALVDPLLARLPISVPHIVTMGMTPRNIPEGYVHALETGDTSQMDPDLADYYSKLRLIISGDLWSADRLWEIIKFNLNAYDYLRDEYVQKNHLGPQRN